MRLSNSCKRLLYDTEGLNCKLANSLPALFLIELHETTTWSKQS